MGKYDRAVKLFVDADPNAMAYFVLDQWRRARGGAVQGSVLRSVEHLSTEFQGDEIDADGLMKVEMEDGSVFLIQIEAQSKLHPIMPNEELSSLQQPALLPLTLLTKGNIDRIIVSEMFKTLLSQKLYDLLPIGQTFASWVLSKVDLDWLRSIS